MPSAFGGTISLYELCVLIEALDELDELELVTELAVLVELAELTTEELSPPREISSFFAHPASVTSASAAAVNFKNRFAFISLTLPDAIFPKAIDKLPHYIL